MLVFYAESLEELKGKSRLKQPEVSKSDVSHRLRIALTTLENRVSHSSSITEAGARDGNAGVLQDGGSSDTLPRLLRQQRESILHVLQGSRRDALGQRMQERRDSLNR